MLKPFMRSTAERRAGAAVLALVVCLGGGLFLGCQAGNGLCTGDLVPCGQTACANLAQDADNCGSCGNVCGPTEMCQEAQCVCRAGTDPCENVGCVVLASDPSNCGACGLSCATDQVCENRVCVPACPNGPCS